MRQHHIELKPSDLKLGKFGSAALEELQSSIVSTSYSTALDAALTSGQAALLTKVAQGNLKRTLVCTVLLSNGMVLVGAHQREKNIVLSRLHYKHAYVAAVASVLQMPAMFDSMHAALTSPRSAPDAGGADSFFEEVFGPKKDETTPPNSNLH